MSYRGMHSSRGRAIHGIDHLRQSITDILFTPVGSRLQRREYGSILPFLIDQPQNAATRMRLMAATATALRRWEPRFKLTRATLSNPAMDGGCTLLLEGVRLDGPDRGKSVDLDIPLIGVLA